MPKPRSLIENLNINCEKYLEELKKSQSNCNLILRHPDSGQVPHWDSDQGHINKEMYCSKNEMQVYMHKS